MRERVLMLPSLWMASLHVRLKKSNELKQYQEYSHFAKGWVSPQTWIDVNSIFGKKWQYQPIRRSSNAVVTRGQDKDTRLAVICTVWNVFTRKMGQYHFSHEIITQNKIKPYTNHVKVIYYYWNFASIAYPVGQKIHNPDPEPEIEPTLVLAFNIYMLPKHIQE